MRKDLIIGLSVSVLVHWSFLFLTKTPSAVVKHVAQADTTIKIEMPELPPEEPEKKPDELPPDEDAVPMAFAPPSPICSTSPSLTRFPWPGFSRRRFIPMKCGGRGSPAKST